MNHTIHIGADHAGFSLKEKLRKILEKKGYQIYDWGAYKLKKDDDYPDFAAAVSKAVQKDGKGILICGSSEGVCIAANKFRGIRAASVWSVQNAKLSREHNDANVLCLSGRQLTLKQAERIALVWLSTPFCGEKRHVRRINKIKRLEQ